MSFVEDFMDLFQCRESAFAQGVPMPGKKDKFFYPPKRDQMGDDVPLTDEWILKHLNGEIQMGIYPLIDDKYTRWVAMDFDGDEGGESALEKAIEQSNALAQVGIASYVEISRSGNGAHVWVFVDGLIEAKTIRAVLHKFLIDAETYDRMFPNQDSANGEYGNLIALPLNGAGFKEGKSVFIDVATKDPIKPREFIATVVKNRVAWIEKLYEEYKHELEETASTVGERTNRESLTGGVKVVTFCNWMKAARARMHQQNQEPEFYALCCQFAQLANGEQLAYEFGKLHPYSDERIDQKFRQALDQNKPHTCKTLREVHGYECTCDIDYGVNHCYELANLSFTQLMSARKGEMKSWNSLSEQIIAKTKQRYKEGGNLGYAYGYDRLDDMTSLRDGDLVVIGARTSIGKTSFAIDITANLTEGMIPVYWGSMEMTAEQLGMKYLGRRAEVDSRAIMEANLDREDWKKLLYFQRDNPNIPLYIDEETRDIDKMIDIFAEMIYKHGKGVIVLDYLEMFQPKPGENMNQLTARISLESKGMAKVLEVPVILLSNFNRKAEEEQLEGSTPADGWLRNSGLLEQTADVILYLLGSRGKGLIKRTVHIQKERFTGMAFEQCILWFDQARSRFLSKRPNEAEDGRIIINKEASTNLDLL